LLVPGGLDTLMVVQADAQSLGSEGFYLQRVLSGVQDGNHIRQEFGIAQKVQFVLSEC